MPAFVGCASLPHRRSKWLLQCADASLCCWLPSLPLHAVSGAILHYTCCCTQTHRHRVSLLPTLRYTVRVTRLLDYGALVEFHTGLSTLLHISQLSWEKVRDVKDLLQEGQVRRGRAAGQGMQLQLCSALSG
jgi:hypothetical protein